MKNKMGYNNIQWNGTRFLKQRTSTIMFYVVSFEIAMLSEIGQLAP